MAEIVSFQGYKFTRLFEKGQVDAALYSVPSSDDLTYLAGYSETLDGILKAHGVKHGFLGSFASPYMLSIRDVLEWFPRGLRREDPPVYDGNLLEILKSRGGWVLGFVTGVVADSNTVPEKTSDIPNNKESLEIFNDGVLGETSSENWNTPFYQLGLQCWLGAQRLGYIPARFIIHPSTLLAYKEGRKFAEQIGYPEPDEIPGLISMYRSEYSGRINGCLPPKAAYMLGKLYAPVVQPNST